MKHFLLDICGKESPVYVGGGKMKVKKKIAIIGLGLMGGSLAYALHGFQQYTIVGYDIDADTLQKARNYGAVDSIATSLAEAVSEADMVFYCSSPNSILENMAQSFPYLPPNCIISEICGVKQDILAWVANSLPDGVSYIGLHPMTGKEVGGFQHADSTLYQNAGFIIVLPECYSTDAVKLMIALLKHIGAGRIVCNKPEEHDHIIAYTSDLMHIASAALCVSYPHNMTMAHTAGSFRDCTRIAMIDADLWTELLTKNANSIVPHLKQYIQSLQDFEDALMRDDKAFIHRFLQTAHDNKQAMLEL